MLKKLLLLTILFYPSMAVSFDDVDEIVLEDSAHIGVKVDLLEYEPMVYLSNITDKIYPSKYVQNIDRLITTVAQSKSANKDLFKNNKKRVKYIPSNTKFTIKKVLKTAVYKNNQPDEYTTYIIEDDNGNSYAMPEFELNEISNTKLTSYEKGLIEEFNKRDNYARVVIYFKKPDLYKDKQPPYSKKELDSVFNFFLDKIKDYEKDKVLVSERNFRLSMSIPIDTIVYLISEFEDLYIEDIEIISEVKQKEEELDYVDSKPRYFNNNLKEWYNR